MKLLTKVLTILQDSGVCYKVSTKFNDVRIDIVKDKRRGTIRFMECGSIAIERHITKSSSSVCFHLKKRSEEELKEQIDQLLLFIQDDIVLMSFHVRVKSKDSADANQKMWDLVNKLEG